MFTPMIRTKCATITTTKREKGKTANHLLKKWNADEKLTLFYVLQTSINNRCQTEYEFFFCIKKRCAKATENHSHEKASTQQNRWRIVFDQWTGTVNWKVVCSAECGVWISLCVFCHQWNIQPHKINFSIFRLSSCSSLFISFNHIMNTSQSECNPSQRSFRSFVLAFFFHESDDDGYDEPTNNFEWYMRYARYALRHKLIVPFKFIIETKMFFKMVFSFNIFIE